MNARKVLIYVVLVVVAINLAIIAVVFTGDNKPARSLPNPNGYDDFVKAGQMISSGYSYDYRQMSKDELVGFVASNAPALGLVREGLKKECRVPENYSAAITAQYVTNLMQMRALALDLCAEARLEVLRGNTNIAVSNYLEAIRFGQESSRGGVMVVKLVGMGCETPALKDLASILDGLNFGCCREIAQTLETLDGKEDPAEENLAQEEKWARATSNWRAKIEALIHYRAERAIRSNFVVNVQTVQKTRRQLMLDFAARAYELEKGKPPTNITNLVPDYLKAVPKDPLTGEDMGLGH